MRALSYQDAHVAMIFKDAIGVRLLSASRTSIAESLGSGRSALLLAADSAGSTLVSFSNANGPIEHYCYSPFGGNAESGQHQPNRRFNGEVFDVQIMGYHLGAGARCYFPGLMRFGAPDIMSPFGAGGVNSYVYCSGDPINFNDELGNTKVPTLQHQAGVAYAKNAKSNHIAFALVTSTQTTSQQNLILNESLGFRTAEKLLAMSPVTMKVFGGKSLPRRVIAAKYSAAKAVEMLMEGKVHPKPKGILPADLKSVQAVLPVSVTDDYRTQVLLYSRAKRPIVLTADTLNAALLAAEFRVRYETLNKSPFALDLEFNVAFKDRLIAQFRRAIRLDP
ncbi:hypothetical protein D3C76_729010 [compost metagenome]